MAIRLTPRVKYPFPDFLTGDAEIVRLYKVGRTGTEIAPLVGMAVSGVYYRLRRLGLTRPRGKYLRTEVIAPGKAVAKLYARGLTARQIALRLKTNHRTILNRLKKAGVVRRSTKRVDPARALSLYKSGFTTDAIGKRLSCTSARIGQLLRSFGVRVKRIGLSGEKNPNWQGGASFQPYSPAFNEALKERIRERDGRKCQLCGITEMEHLKRYARAHRAPFGQKNPVHHVNYDKQDCREENLITLCHECNSRVNFGRSAWQTAFQKKLGVAL